MLTKDLETLCRLRASAKPIFIYGNMNTAKEVYRLLWEHGIQPRSFVVDAFAFQDGQKIDGLEVHRIEDVVRAGDNVVVGFDNIEKTRALFSLANWLVFNVFHFVSAGCLFHWDDAFCQKHAAAFEALRAGFADEKSRRTLDALIAVHAGRASDAIQRLLALGEPSQYFNALTFSVDSDEDVFFDCGAFDGDTVRQYADFTGGRYKHIVAFEPLEENRTALQRRIQNIPRVSIVEKGTWDANTRLRFNANTSASSVQAEGELEIPVTTIDDIAAGGKVSFIKMDVEGSECETLCGARRTIERWHPKLAVCVYHKPEDLFRCHALIRDYGMGQYRFYLRHHSNRLSETVLYAVPT